MAQNSKIEWCDHTVNLWWGCAKVHTGCKNCYAEYLSDTRYKNNLWGEKSHRKVVLSAFKDLDKFQRLAKESGTIHRVFVGSMMDIFEDPKPILNSSFGSTNDIRKLLFNKIEFGEYNNLLFLFLTKRPENINIYLPNNWWANCPKNVMFGTSISDQTTALEYAPNLWLNTPLNSKRFLSVEPQVGFIENIDLSSIDWVIQGGESGHKKREFNLNWAYHLKNECQKSNVPYFFKQIDKIQPIPDDLMVREFPLLM